MHLEPRHLRTRLAHPKWRGRGAWQVTVATALGRLKLELEPEKERAERGVNLNSESRYIIMPGY